MDRFFADKFDADGKWYVFDDGNGGAQYAGPFDNARVAEKAADDLNEFSKHYPESSVLTRSSS